MQELFEKIGKLRDEYLQKNKNITLKSISSLINCYNCLIIEELEILEKNSKEQDVESIISGICEIYSSLRKAALKKYRNNRLR